MKTQLIKSQLSADERETIFNISYAEDDIVYMDTTILKDYNKAVKQGWELVEQYVYEDGSVCGGQFKAPRRCLSIHNIKKRELSDKQIANLEKLRSLHKHTEEE